MRPDFLTVALAAQSRALRGRPLRLSWALLLLALPLSLKAQAGEPLSLARAIELATSSTPAMQAAAGTRAVIVGRARAEAQFTNPQFELRRENLGNNVPYDDFLTLTLPVSVTGRRFALRDALGAARVRGSADSLAVVRAAEYSAAQAWWEAWVGERSYAAAAEQAARFAELARFDSIRAAEGAVSEASALRTRLEAERAAYAGAVARAAAARARGDLAARLGLDTPAALSLATEAPAPATALPQHDAAVTLALTERPDVIAAQAAAREADRRRVAERRNTLNDIGVNAGYKGTGDIPGALVAFYITPPLLNANGGARELSEGTWLLAEADRRATELRVANEVRAALEAARAMDAATGSLDLAFLARADTIAAATEAAYREGAATLTETLEAMRALTELRIAGIRAIADRALTRLDLRRAMGAPALETQ